MRPPTFATIALFPSEDILYFGQFHMLMLLRNDFPASTYPPASRLVLCSLFQLRKCIISSFRFLTSSFSSFIPNNAQAWQSSAKLAWKSFRCLYELGLKSTIRRSCESTPTCSLHSSPSRRNTAEATLRTIYFAAAVAALAIILIKFVI